MSKKINKDKDACASCKCNMSSSLLNLQPFAERSVDFKYMVSALSVRVDQPRESLEGCIVLERDRDSFLIVCLLDSLSDLIRSVSYSLAQVDQALVEGWLHAHGKCVVSLDTCLV